MSTGPGGASRAPGQAEGSWPVSPCPPPCFWQALLWPWHLRGCTLPHTQGPGPWPAQAYLGVGGSPRDNHRALKLQVPQGTYEMLEVRRDGAAWERRHSEPRPWQPPEFPVTALVIDSRGPSLILRALAMLWEAHERAVAAEVTGSCYQVL